MEPLNSLLQYIQIKTQLFLVWYVLQTQLCAITLKLSLYNFI